MNDSYLTLYYFDINSFVLNGKQIEMIFTTTMGFRCNVEKVIGYDTGQTGNNSYNSALSHFIDETKEEAEPVLANVIIA